MATEIDITIKDLTTGDYYVVPVLPETIPYELGDKEADTVNILGVGEVDFLRGKQLDGFTLDSFFPAEYDPSYCSTSDLLTPLEYRDLFNDWKNDAAPLQIIIPAAGVNMPMTLRSFRPTVQGAQGDIRYTATFRQHKTVRPKKIAVGSTTAPSKKEGAADRPKAPAKAKAKTYKVKAGDSLTKIAKSQGIKNWRDLYNKNKKVIGSNPNKISVGMVLTL